MILNFNLNKKKTLISLILLLGSFTWSYAQITGSSSVQANSTHIYQFNNGQSQYPNNWIISGGTLLSSWKSGSTYYVSAKWDGGMSNGTVVFTSTGNYLYVSIASSAPSTPSTPTIQSTNCGNTVLARGNPPSGVTWYWQSTSSGTSTSNSSATITKTSGSTQYLRARNSSGTWSSSSSNKSYSINTVPAIPSAPTVVNDCGSAVLTKGSSPSGITWYWQSSSSGTSTSNSTTTISRTSGTVYYLRARNNSSGCWSSARTVNYSINSVPSIPSSPTVTNNCGSSILTKGSSPSGITWYWQSSSSGTSTSSSSTSITRNSGTVYYLRARNNSSGCWSSTRTVNYSINSVPATPSTPTITNNCGSTVLTRGSHPSGQTLYWQSSSGGTSTGNSGSTVTRTSGTVYYLRSRNNTTGCWSSTRTVNYSINSAPATPSTPTITNNCGSTVLTRGSHPSGQTLYWQSSSGGTSTGNSGSTVTRTSGTVYYLRSRNNTTGCWSSTRTVNYSINSAPATPSTPTITNNCGSTVLTRGSHPSGQTLYWQSSSGGTSTGNSGSTVTRTSGTVYYLRSRNNTTGCWSSTRTVNYSINSAPATPSTPTITNNCGSTVLTRGSHPSGQTLYWQSSSGGTSTGNSGSTVTRTSGTVYYLRSRNNTTGCWSSTRTVNYSINSAPATPSTPTITNNCGSTVLTRGSHPSGQTLYWQSSSGGTSTSNSGSTVTRTSGTVYYLRSRNNSSGCWSSARTVNYTINLGPIWYADTDGDGFGDPNATQRSCTRPAGYVENKNDLAINTPGTNFGTTSNTYTSATKSDENYIFTRSYQNSMDSPNDITNNNDVIEQITYFDGSGRPMQNIAIKASGSEASQLNLQANISEWSMDWTAGSGGTAFFNQNGTTSENLRINGADPHGNISLLWECGNEADNSSDGGWNTDYFNVDKNSTYRYTVWVKRNYSNDGKTYHGTQNVNNLSGSANSNPYFWSGDLPQLNQWYLLVGIVHPVGYSGGDTGVSGVYDLQGNRVIDGNEFTWRSDTSTSRFRSYLYYATDVSVRQYFYAPVVQQINGSENSIAEIISGTEGQSSPLTDIITHIGYDDFGRQDKDWLPYHETTGSVGSYRGDKSLATQQYYQTNYADDFPGITNAQDINAYSQKGLESSALNRVLEQAAPGEAWKQGGGHEIEFDYQSNTHDALNPTDATKDNVKLFKVSLALANNTHTPTLVDGGYYEAYTLYKTTTKDENHSGALKDHTTEEFKDKQGRVLLKRTYNAEVEHDTYYVYDDYGNLTYVMPPLMNASTTSLATINTQMNDLGYQYKYDSRNRLVEKRIPGKDWEYIVYDNLDRPVLTQDANLRVDDKWLFTKYDAFGRVAYTGIHTNTSHTGRTSMQSNFNTQNNTPAELFESKDNNGTGYDNSYYTNANFPNTNLVLHTVNYYDDYNFDKASLVLPIDVFGKAVVNYIDTDKTKTKGLATGSRVRVLNVSPAKWITTVTGYNVKGQPIYVASYNDYLETTDVVKNELDFVGKVTKTVTDHTKGVSPVTTAVTTEDLFTYDHIGRLKKQTQELNNTDVLEVLVENTYDNLGQLTSKAVGGKTTQGRLQNVDYTYNIRGWLKQINNPTSLGNDLFSFKLNYNTVDHHAPNTGKELYNGNISETEWKTKNLDQGLKWYKYSYDALNRITSGLANSSNYNLTSVSYDKNGNINNLVRQGVRAMSGSTVTSYGEMDNLSYTYQSNSNQLLKVTDAATLDQYGFIDDAENTAADPIDDYTYDDNGNMLTDQNKGITSITYNHLNLPTDISINGNGNVGTISYIYDAIGTKLSKIVSGVTTYYAGNYVYEGSSLKFFNHSEGYIEPKDENNLSLGYNYVYQYKDHLGNVRLSYMDSDSNGSINASTEILEENNYYPFGLKHKGYNNNPTSSNIALKKTYNGKEFQDELDLNWHDYGARNYDAALGRWMNVDNHADSYFDYSPYNYAINNPINVIDPDGNDIYILIWYTKDKSNGGDWVGHSGIAIDNYKTQNKKDANGNDVLDANGNVVTEQVADGTYTYYDLWPNDGVGKYENQDDVKADYTNGIQINSLSDLMNNDPTNQRTGNVSAEGRAADGIVQIPTTPEQDADAKKHAQSEINSNKDYNACYNNCSSFVQRTANAALPNNINARETVNLPGYLKRWPFNYKDAKSVTPNKLYNTAMSVKGAKNIKGPKKKKTKSFKQYSGM